MFLLKRFSFSVIFVSVFLTACGGGSSSSDDSNNVRATSIATLGDSIGAGACGTRPWGIRLGDELGVPVTNNSRNSRTTAIGLGLVDGLLAGKPSHLVVLLGTNDARQFIAPSTAISNMTAIVQKARAAGVVPIIGTVPAILTSNSQNANAAQISSGYQNIEGAVVADIRSALGTNAGFFCDGLHPNTAGQSVIVSTFLGKF
ncbi:MAG: SGNH/GDSL hydrolase family protein [Arenicella sp.]